MFAPLVTTKGEVVFVAPPHVVKIEAGPELPEEAGLAPDNKPWPTSLVYLAGGLSPLHVKGTPVMILNAWYGPAPEPQSKVLTVPPGTRIRN